MKRSLLSTACCILISIFVFNACKNDEDPAVIVADVTPDRGPAGTVVTITGSNFSENASVSFNGVEGVISSVTPGQIIVAVPANATSGIIRVTSHGKTADGPNFTVDFPPVITSISPSQAKPGDEVTITGNHFKATASSNLVAFNGVPATVLSASDTELKVTVPASATSGVVTVAVDNMIGTGPSFTVIPLVVITSITPEEGPACTVVTIVGENFDTTIGNNIVKINGANVTVLTATATQLTASILTTSTTGAVTVETNDQTATGPTFTVTPNEATVNMDAIDYSYSNFCSAIVSDRFWISASGGFNSPKPSWAIHFAGQRPDVAGTYDADIAAERPGETWDFTPASVTVSFDSEQRMVVTFSNVMLKGRPGTPDKAFSGTAKVY